MNKIINKTNHKAEMFQSCTYDTHNEVEVNCHDPKDGWLINPDMNYYTKKDLVYLAIASRSQDFNNGSLSRNSFGYKEYANEIKELCKLEKKELVKMVAKNQMQMAKKIFSDILFS